MKEMEDNLYQELSDICTPFITSVLPGMDMKENYGNAQFTILRSLRAAGLVNFLAKRKHGEGFPLLVHHSLLYSVS